MTYYGYIIMIIVYFFMCDFISFWLYHFDYFILIAVEEIM